MKLISFERRFFWRRLPMLPPDQLNGPNDIRIDS
jgi:hypothetical protein